MIAWQDTVTRIVQDQPHDDSMVDRLISFKHFATTTLSTSFSSSLDFTYALQDAFTTGFKSRRIKPAEMIAKHIDRLLRKGEKGRTEEEYRRELEDVLGLYRSTDDKDVFRTFYQRALAKRLLLARSASDDVERSMLDMLKKGACFIYLYTPSPCLWWIGLMVCVQITTPNSEWATRCSQISISHAISGKTTAKSSQRKIRVLISFRR